MKIFGITIAVWALIMLYGCGKDTFYVQESLEIVCRAGAEEFASRAPVNSGAGNLPTSAVEVYFARTNDATSANWATVTGTQAIPAGNAGGTVPGTISTTGAVTFGIRQYYNSVATKYSYLVGYYPASNVNYPSTANPGQLQLTIDGKTDIMHTPAVSGNRNSSSPLTFAFSHKLCLLQFYVKASALPAVTSALWGKISNITIVNQNTQYTLTLPSTGTFGGTAGNINTWTAADGVPAGTSIPTDGSSAFVGQALVQPAPYVQSLPLLGKNGNYVITFKAAATGLTYTLNIGTSNSTTTVAGNTHVITLSFLAVLPTKSTADSIDNLPALEVDFQ